MYGSITNKTPKQSRSEIKKFYSTPQSLCVRGLAKVRITHMMETIQRVSISVNSS